jgi:hypothetical protein
MSLSKFIFYRFLIKPYAIVLQTITSMNIACYCLLFYQNMFMNSNINIAYIVISLS